MNLDEIPAKIGAGTTDGINDAFEALVHDNKSAQELAELLGRDPRGTIRRVISLTADQRATLNDMTDAEIRELVAPVIEALGQPNPSEVQLELAPAGAKCKLTIIIEL